MQNGYGPPYEAYAVWFHWRSAILDALQTCNALEALCTAEALQTALAQLRRSAKLRLWRQISLSIPAVHFEQELCARPKDLP